MEEDKEQSKPAEKPSGYVKMLMNMAGAKELRDVPETGSEERDVKAFADAVIKSLKERRRKRWGV